MALEISRDDGKIESKLLQTDIALRKEVGNARLVSGDTMIWVGKGSLTCKDSNHVPVSTRTVRLENGKRCFVFTIPLDAVGRQFYTELKNQVEGVKVRKKKRKLHEDLSLGKVFTPVNTPLSPTKEPLPLLTLPVTETVTLKSSPLADLGIPPMRHPSPLSVSIKQSTPYLHSPSDSPFRSPLRKKSRLSKSPLSGNRVFTNMGEVQARTPASKLQSPARALKLRAGRSSPHLKRHSSHAPDSQSSDVKHETNLSSGEDVRRKSITGSIKKRVRSLKLILDNDSSIKEAEAQAQNKLTSHFLQMNLPPSFHDKSARKFNVPVDIGSEGRDIVDANVTAVIASESPEDGAKRSTHGLLNLGNYCYMNAIVQALAALPEFVTAVLDEGNLLRAIQMHLNRNSKGKTMEQVKTVFNKWRTSGDAKQLPLQYTLSQMLQRVANGSETPINPEPLKNVMGKKNSIFATHFQQDAHEFLLNLVSEYEQELVQMVHDVTAKIQEEATTSSTAQNSSLVHFFRNDLKTKSAVQEKSDRSVDAKLDLICRLTPAKSFRAEFNRTLTCRKCGYSRKQPETFYDFSLDLPCKSFSEPQCIAEQEPQAQPSPEKQCFCDLTAVSAREGYYCCPKASCSYQQKIENGVEPAKSPAKPTIAVMKSTVSPLMSTGDCASRPQHIELGSLIRKQFDIEVLQVNCEQCKEGREAQSAYEIQSLPSVLVFHLKRFEVNPHTGDLYKRCDPIVPPAKIDLANFINLASSTGGETRYALKVRILRMAISNVTSLWCRVAECYSPHW